VDSRRKTSLALWKGALVASALLWTACRTPEPTDRWSQVGGGAGHNAYREQENEVRRPRVLWHVPGASGPPVLAEGTLYACGARLFAIDAATGEVQAALAPDDPGCEGFAGSPAVFERRVIARRADGVVSAFDPALARALWRWTPSAAAGAGPTPSGVVADGRYVFALGRELVALRARDGGELWCRAFDAPVVMTPAAAGRRLYVGTRGGDFFCLDGRDGSTRWVDRGDAGYAWTTPVASSYRVFISDRGVRGGRDGMLKAFDQRDGRLLWATPVRASGFSTPTVTDEHVIGGFGPYVGRFDKRSGRLDQGRLIHTGRNPFGSPTLVGRTLYFGNLDGHLYAHDDRSGELVWAFRVVDGRVSSFVYAEGRLYVATTAGLFALVNDPAERGTPRGFVLAWGEEAGENL
jgi:outer membrane protein assembly factor BamB